MNLRRLVATSAIAVASLAVWTGTAYAEPTTPAPSTTEENSAINWATRVENGGVITTVDAGLFRASDDDKSVVLEDNEGNEVLSLPLSFNLNGVEFPYGVEYTDEGRTVKLIPNLAAPIGLEPAALEQNVASPAENLKAEQAFQSQLALASAVGGLTGTIIGAVAGAVLGLPLLGAGSVITIPIAGAAGGFIGTLVAGGPTLVVAGLDLLNTYNAAPGTTKFAN
ncbi:ammonium transporter [Rhodococcoides corynebacterioides]|uniref:Ammonium transporter n=1 Tax=Rhodococcoides corynebacterioides TaxID=53972 RepID=A0ABS7P7Q9_9NOCA|nr:ammonium transporter [Rhodococcus corynebacterioides]MBY6368081.1 ammonium transporter [Rhodococcus corynebacterioides]MBY6406535.1 ammonium transporter [Rhodococcus corynebacterioides]